VVVDSDGCVGGVGDVDDVSDGVGMDVGVDGVGAGTVVVHGIVVSVVDGGGVVDVGCVYDGGVDDACGGNVVTGCGVVGVTVVTNGNDNSKYIRYSNRGSNSKCNGNRNNNGNNNNNSGNNRK